MRDVVRVVAVILLVTGCQNGSVDREARGPSGGEVSDVLSSIAESAAGDMTDEAAAAPELLGAKPIAKKVPYKITRHGHTRIDNYYWMRDDTRKDPEIIAHLEAENSYAAAMLRHTDPLQEKLFNEITHRIKRDDASVPFKYRDHYYYSRFEGDKEYPIYARKRASLEAEEEILLDGNAMAAGFDYFNIGDYAVSTDQNLLAYSIDTLSRRIYDISFKNLRTGEVLPDKLEHTTGQVVWANDNATVFYIRKDPQTLLGFQVYRHRLGTPQARDVLVYEETDRAFYTWLDKTKDDSTLVIVHASTLSRGASVLSADRPAGAFRRFAPLQAQHEYSIARLGQWYYILTNWQAQNFRVMKVRQDQTGDKAAWQEVIPHSEKVLLQDFDVFNKHLVVDEKERGQSRVRVVNLADKRSHVVAFDEPVYVVSLDTNVSVDTDTLRLRYGSLTTPLTIYDYNMASREKTVLKQEEVVGEFDPRNYQSERFFVEARDGEEIPVSIVYRRDRFSKDGTNPLYQFGYGSYGYNIEPYFSAARLSLLDRGFVFAIAHVRGSQTLGRAWYEDGKLFNKKNTFFDFIDVTKALVEQKYGAKDQIFAAGGSAGGLLMGAVINMAPELYRGVSASVPFVDVVTTMLDESIPLTTNEYDEWGNPNNADAYEYILSYSPYDNVKAQDYPNLLVTTGLHDSQVQYFEPAKWVAKLRELKTDDNMLVFKTNMEAGHSGASGRFRRNKLRALEYAFFMDLAGIAE